MATAHLLINGVDYELAEVLDGPQSPRFQTIQRQVKDLAANSEPTMITFSIRRGPDLLTDLHIAGGRVATAAAIYVPDPAPPQVH